VGAVLRVLHRDLELQRARNVRHDHAIVEVEGARVLWAGERLLGTGLGEQQDL
jgi:hypothetical protein